MTAVTWEQKKVHGYLISFEPQMIRSSYKDHLSKLKYWLSYSRLFESYMSLSFWRLLKIFGDKNLEISRQDQKTFYSYATSSSKIVSYSRQTLAVKLLGKICMQYLLFRIIPLTAANLEYCFWLCISSLLPKNLLLPQLVYFVFKLI